MKVKITQSTEIDVQMQEFSGKLNIFRKQFASQSTVRTPLELPTGL